VRKERKSLPARGEVVYTKKTQEMDLFVSSCAASRR